MFRVQLHLAGALIAATDDITYAAVDVRIVDNVAKGSVHLAALNYFDPLVVQAGVQKFLSSTVADEPCKLRKFLYILAVCRRAHLHTRLRMCLLFAGILLHAEKAR